MACQVFSWRMILKYKCYRKQRHVVILVTCQRPGTNYTFEVWTLVIIKPNSPAEFGRILGGPGT